MGSVWRYGMFPAARHSIRSVQTLKLPFWPCWISEDFKEAVLKVCCINLCNEWKKEWMNEWTYGVLCRLLTLCSLCYQNVNGHQQELERHLCHRIRLRRFCDFCGRSSAVERCLFLVASSFIPDDDNVIELIVWWTGYPPTAPKTVISSNNDCNGIQAVLKSFKV